MRTTTRATLDFPEGGRRFDVVGSGRDANLGTVAATGRYEEHLLALWPQVVTPDAVVLDVGANVGLHTLPLSALAACVYAFEPSAANHAFLVENLVVNGAANVVPLRLALGAAAGSTTLSMNPDAPGGAFVSDELSLHETETVERVRLDDWAEGLERLDLVKLDVEGSELDVLAGGGRTLERFHPDLVVELNPMAVLRVAGADPARLFHHLAGIYPTLLVVGPTRRVTDWAVLEAHLSRHGIADLWCTTRPVEAPPLKPPRGRGPTFHFRPACTLALEAPGVVGAGERFAVAGTLTNRSAHALRPEDSIALSYHWVTPAGETVEFEGRRTPLRRALRPGATAPVDVEVEAPAQPGDYVVEATVLQEGVAWFEHLAAGVAVRLPVTVR